MATLTMPKTQREQLMVVLGVVGLLAVAGFWWFRYRDESTRLNGVEAAANSLDSLNQLAKTELARGTVAQLREQSIQYAENLVLMRRLVPAANEVPALIDDVSRSARRVGLDVGTIEPLGAEIGTDFDAYKYRLSVSGTFHALAEFLANVGSLQRIVVPVNLSMTGVAANPLGRTALTRFELHTYVARTAPPATRGGM